MADQAQEQPPALAAAETGNEIDGAEPQARLVAVGAPQAGAAIAIAELGGERVLLVADADDASVHVVDLERRTERSRTRLEGAPAAVLVGADGRLYAALRDRGRVEILEAGAEAGAGLRKVGELETAAEPVGLAMSPDGETLLAISGWGHALTAFSTRTRERRFTVDLPREPRGIVVSEDGRRAFVSHAVGSTISVVSLGSEGEAGEEAASSGPAAHGVSLRGEDVDATPTCGCRDFFVKQRRYAVQGFALARVADRILAPMASVHPEPEEPSGYGDGSSGFPPHEAAVISLDVATEKAVLRVRDASSAADGTRTKETHMQKARDPSPCLLPRAAAALPGRGSVLVACLGIDSVIEIGAEEAPLGRSVRGRWAVAAGPSAIAVDEMAGEAYVWSQFGREISVLALGKGDQGSAQRSVGAKGKAAAPGVARPATTMALAPEAALSAELSLGRRLFHAAGDPRISGDGRACASCHPDGRDDGLVWKTTMGRLQTPTLAGRLTGTAPYGWGGDTPTVKEHLGQTFKRLGGKGLVGAELDAVIAYAMSLDVPAAHGSPAATVEVARGQEVFTSVETMCTICHVEAKGFTDGSAHDVGSGAALDTPSLRFLGGTPPYFHDGRYATIRDLLKATDGKMGKVSHLGEEDLGALEAYLKSL